MNASRSRSLVETGKVDVAEEEREWWWLETRKGDRGEDMERA